MRFHFPADLMRWTPLIKRLTAREIQARYRGSLLGRSWTLIHPLIMLIVYTFVFSVIFPSRWSSTSNIQHLPVAINIFVGLFTFNVISETINTAPRLIASRPNFVTKIIFPLHILSVVSVFVAMFHALTSLLVLLAIQLLVNHWISPELLWLPLVWLPLMLGSIAISWVLSALGVFLRDLPQITSAFTSMILFVSAVFYPLSSLPGSVRSIMQLNPIVVIIEQTRRVTVEGLAPNLGYIVLGTLLSIAACEIALRFFHRARTSFADLM